MRTATPVSLCNLDLWNQQNSQTTANSQVLQLLEDGTAQTGRALALVITTGIVWVDSLIGQGRKEMVNPDKRRSPWEVHSRG